MTLDLPWTSYQLDHLCGSARRERDGDEIQMPGETSRAVSGRRVGALTLLLFTTVFKEEDTRSQKLAMKIRKREGAKQGHLDAASRWEPAEAGGLPCSLSRLHRAGVSLPLPSRGWEGRHGYRQVGGYPPCAILPHVTIIDPSLPDWSAGDIASTFY